MSMFACRSWLRAAVLVACGTLLAPGVAPAESRPAVEPRPRVGLVLSGGGARGAAHVGVLKVLEELRVPVDAIAGTSMGAVVGGLYASGMSAADIEALLGSLDWQDAFRDRPGRAALNFRRKQDDREFLVRLPLGLSAGRLKYPRGLIQGQKLNQKLRAATLPVAHVDDFSRLPIPFRALATDLETGMPVVLSSGSLATAVRASMSAPGVFAPVEIDGRVLVDGGVAENLPVEAVRELGVDVIVAVDVSSPLLPSRELGSALAVSQQMVAILINRATERARATLSARDVLVAPDLGPLASTDFARVFEALRAGEAGARRAAPRLAALALAPAEYADHVARRAERATPARVDFVQVDAASGRYRKLIESALAPAVGRPAEGESLDRAIRSLYGRDLFETLDYRVVEAGGRSGLEVSARRKGWGPNYLRIGLELQDDFQGDTSYTAGLRFVVTEANPYMAEWNVDLQIGERPRFAVEFFQPLGYASPWFVAPRFAVGSRSLRTETPDGSPLGEYRVRERQYGLDLGRELGTWGEVRAGVRRASGTTRLQFGTPTPRAPAAFDFDGGGWFARFAVDRLDSVSFPRHGELFQLQWDAERRALGADGDVDTARADWLVARSRGRHTLIGWASGGSALDGTDAVQRFFPLGGFLNLSGLAADSLAGPHFGIGRLVYLNRLRPRGAGPFDVPMYVGVSLEAGNAWERRGDASFGDLRRNAGAFFGLETLLGPLYLGGGYDESGESAYYLFLGRTF